MFPVTFGETQFSREKTASGFEDYIAIGFEDYFSASTSSSSALFNASTNGNIKKRMEKLKKFASKALNIAHRAIAAKDATPYASIIKRDHHPSPIHFVKKFAHKITANKAAKNELRNEIFNEKRASMEQDEGQMLRAAASLDRKRKFDQRRKEHQRNETCVFYTLGEHLREDERERFRKTKRADQRQQADIPAILRGYQSRMSVDTNWQYENEEERHWIYGDRRSGSNNGFETEHSLNSEDVGYSSGVSEGSDGSGSDSDSGYYSESDPKSDTDSDTESSSESDSGLNPEDTENERSTTSSKRYLEGRRHGGIDSGFASNVENSMDDREDEEISGRGSSIFDDVGSIIGMWEAGRDDCSERSDDEHTERGSSIFSDMGSIICMWEEGRNE